MSYEKKPCVIPGCPRMGKSLGRKHSPKFEKEYDKDGYLVRKRKREVPYYSTFCRIHQKAYNRA